MAEIETQTVGRDERTLLRDVRAEVLTQRLVQEVSDRVVGAQHPAALSVDPQLDGIADLQRAVRRGGEMDVQIARLPHRVAHRELGAGWRENGSGITNLAPRLGIERRLIDDNGDLVPGAGLGNALAMAQHR